MEMNDIFIGIIGVLLAIVSFFLIRTMARVDLTHDLSVQNKMDIALLKQKTELNYQHLAEMLASLIKSVDELNKSFKK